MFKMDKRDKFTIHVDDREPESLYEELVYQTTTNEKFEVFNVKPQHRLAVGDIVCGRLCVERKTPEDLSGSIFDGRIWSQVKRMAGMYDFVYIFMSGNPAWLNNQSKEKGIYTAMTDAEIRHNVKARMFMSDEMLVYSFLMLCLKLSKKLDPRYEKLRAYRPKKSIRDDRIRMLMTIPVVGEKTAKNIMNTAGTLHNLCHMMIPELKKISGVADTRAKHIYKLLNEGSDIDEQKEEET